MKDRYKYLGTLFRRGRDTLANRQASNNPVRKLIARNERVRKILDRGRRLGARYPSYAIINQTERLGDDTEVSISINPFGLWPIYIAHVAYRVAKAVEELIGGPGFFGVPYSDSAPAGWGKPLDPPPGTAGGADPERVWILKEENPTWTIENADDWGASYSCGNMYWTRGSDGVTISWGWERDGGGYLDNACKYSKDWRVHCNGLAAAQDADDVTVSQIYCNGRVVVTLPTGAGSKELVCMGAALYGEYLIVVGTEFYWWYNFPNTFYDPQYNDTKIFYYPIQDHVDGGIEVTTSTPTYINSDVGTYRWAQAWCFSSDGSKGASLGNYDDPDNFNYVDVYRATISGDPPAVNVAITANQLYAFTESWVPRLERTSYSEDTSCTGSDVETGDLTWDWNTSAGGLVEQASSPYLLPDCEDPVNYSVGVSDSKPIKGSSRSRVVDFVKEYDANWGIQAAFTLPRTLAIDYKGTEEQLLKLVAESPRTMNINIKVFEDITRQQSVVPGLIAVSAPSCMNGNDLDDGWSASGGHGHTYSFDGESGFDQNYDFAINLQLKINDVDFFKIAEIDEVDSWKALLGFADQTGGQSVVPNGVSVALQGGGDPQPALAAPILSGNVWQQGPFWGTLFGICATRSFYTPAASTSPDGMVSNRKLRRLLYLDLATEDIIYYEEDGITDDNDEIGIYDELNSVINKATPPDTHSDGSLLTRDEGGDSFGSDEGTPKDQDAVVNQLIPLASGTTTKQLNQLEPRKLCELNVNVDGEAGLASGLNTDGERSRLVAAKFEHLHSADGTAEIIALVTPEGDPLSLAAATGDNQMVGRVCLLSLPEEDS